MKITKKDIGIRIKRAREKAGLSQTELANIISRTDGAISSYEQGDSLPRMEQASLIAKALNVSLDWLFLGANMDSNNIAEWTEEEINLLADFRKLSKYEKKVAANIIKNLPQAYDRKSPMSGSGEK